MQEAKKVKKPRGVAYLFRENASHAEPAARATAPKTPLR